MPIFSPAQISGTAAGDAAHRPDSTHSTRRPFTGENARRLEPAPRSPPEDADGPNQGPCREPPAEEGGQTQLGVLTSQPAAGAVGCGAGDRLSTRAIRRGRVAYAARNRAVGRVTRHVVLRPRQGGDHGPHLRRGTHAANRGGEIRSGIARHPPVVHRRGHRRRDGSHITSPGQARGPPRGEDRGPRPDRALL